jgi:anti-anti-sigma factor
LPSPPGASSRDRSCWFSTVFLYQQSSAPSSGFKNACPSAQPQFFRSRFSALALFEPPIHPGKFSIRFLLHMTICYNSPFIHSSLPARVFSFEGGLSMQTELLVGRTHGGTVVRVVGRGTMLESPAFRKLVEANLPYGPVYFDASQCEYLDSTFLGCLIALQKTSEQSRGRFVIAAAHDTQLKLFSLSSLYRYFNFADPHFGEVKDFEAVDIERLDTASLGRHIMQCHGTLAERGGREAPAFLAIAKRLAEELGDTSAE